MANIKLKLELNYLHTRHQCIQWFGFLQRGQFGLKADYLKVIKADGATYVIHDDSNSMRPHGFSKQLIWRMGQNFKGAESMLELNCNFSGINWVNPIDEFDKDGVTFEDMSEVIEDIARRVCLEGESLGIDEQCQVAIADDSMIQELSKLRKFSSNSPCTATKSIKEGLGADYAKEVESEDVSRLSDMVTELTHEKRELQTTIRLMKLQAEELRRKPARSSVKLRSVYLMKDSHNGLYKIGKSKNPLTRERTLQSEKPSVKMVFNCLETDDFNEKSLHLKFADQRKRGEWFDLSPAQVRFISRQAKLAQ